MPSARTIFGESFYSGDYLPHYKTLKALSEGTIEEKESKVEPVISTEENEKSFKVEFSVPGLKREDLLVGINEGGNLCVVSVKYKEKEIRKGKKKETREIVETVKKVIPLPENVDTTFQSAYCSAGKLNVFFTKSLQPKAKRPLTIMVY